MWRGVTWCSPFPRQILKAESLPAFGVVSLGGGWQTWWGMVSFDKPGWKQDNFLLLLIKGRVRESHPSGISDHSIGRWRKCFIICDSQISERKCCRRFICFIDEVEICWYLRECWAVDFARQQKFFFQMQDLLQNKRNDFWHLPTSQYFVIFLSFSLCFTFGVAIWPGPSFWASCCIASWNYCRWNIVIGLVHFFSSPELSLFAHPPGQCRPLPLNRDELELEMHITMVFGLGCIGSLCCL